MSDYTSLQLLLDSFVAVASERDAETILEQAVDLARLQSRARYGAGALLDDDGIGTFVYRGLTSAQVDALPNFPEGLGMLGAVLQEKAPIRRDRLQDDERSVGFPLEHVPMAAFLGVPIMFETELLGGLYLTKAPGEGGFAEQDELFLSALANQVGLALEASRLLREKQEVNEQLEAVNRLKSEFVSMTSHELLTPLTSILGFAWILRSRWEALPEDKRRHFVEMIDDQAHGLQRLVNQLLEMGRIEAGAIATDSRVIDVEQTLRGVAHELAAPGTPFEVACPEGLEALADPHHVRQILVNYMGNALKYGVPPFVVEATAVTYSVEIRVRDQGDGVPSDFTPNLFQKFSRAGTARGRHGFGLGLSIVQALAEAQGGRAWYEPNEPKGACFCFSLPLPEDVVQ